MAGNPWNDIMAAQAQAVGDDGHPWSTPEEQMVSQGYPPENMEDIAAMGRQAAAQNPELLREAVRMRIKERGPMSQEKVPYDTMMRDLAAQYDNKSKAAMNAQTLGTQQMESDYNQMKRMPTQTDLVPFASMAKFLNPENDFVDAAKSMRGETPEQKAEKLFTLQNMLQQRKENMSKQQLSALKEQIDAYKASKSNDLEKEYMISKINLNKSLSGQRGDGKILPETSVQKVSDYDSSLKELHDMADGFGVYADTMGPAQGRVAGMNPFNTKAQSFQADLDRARQVIGKAVEGGVLRKEDEEKYKKMLPNLADTPEVGVYKMKQFANKMSTARNNYLSTLKKAGYNTKNIEAVTESPSANDSRKKEVDGSVKEYNGKKYKLTGDTWNEVK